MNKLLLGTTALVGASLLMAGGAYAAKPKVKWGGAIEFTVGGSNQDNDGEILGGGAGEGSKGPSAGYAFRTNSELKVNASGKTDAGMKWKAEVQIEADTNVGPPNKFGSETVIDETWIRFSGSWGSLTVGNQDGVEESYLISGDDAVGKAGDGGVDGNWQDFIDAQTLNSRLWDEPDDNEDSSDATKIIYVTPRVGGFGGGVSFTPDLDAHGQATSRDDEGDFQNAWALAVDFKKKLGGVKVHAAAAVHIGDNKDETKEDLEAWSLGATIGYGGWKIGGNYMNKGDTGEARANTFDDDATAWTAGIGYSQGPVHLGVAYLHSEVETSDPDDDERDVLVVGASYVLGGGAMVIADIFWLDEDAGSGGSENEGIGFLIGVGVKW